MLRVYINIIQYPSISINILQYDTKNTQLLLDAFGMFLEHLTKYQKKPFCRIETETIQNHPLGSIKIHQDPLCWGQRFAARSLAMCSHSAREQQSAAAAGVKKIRRGDFGTQPLTFFYILLHSLTKWFWFSFWKQTKVYRMVLCFLHFSAFFLNVSSTTQENMHNDTKWFLIFS